MSLHELKISDARAIGNKLKTDGIIILAFDQDNGYVKGVSWGKDSERCKYYGKLMDTIIDTHFSE